MRWLSVWGCDSLHAAPYDELVRRAFEWTLRLDRAAAYDSTYLALAEELGCDLWTADVRLVRAVDRPWVRGASAPGSPGSLGRHHGAEAGPVWLDR